MASSTDPFAFSLEDELESFPERTITCRRPQQTQHIRRIMGVKDNTLNPVLTPSALDKLKRYLPVGTWTTFTALESWAFSIRPETLPSTPGSNCNVDQHDVLLAALIFSFVAAFSSVFVQSFKYDPSGGYIIYPPPQGFTVPTRVTDPHTAVTFPCKTKNGQYFWPVFDNSGNFVYDQARGLKVLLLKNGVAVEVGDHIPWYMPDFVSQSKKRSKMPNEEIPSTISVNEGDAAIPHLKPYWRGSIVGVKGAKYYLDFHISVWGHAFLSVLAFGTLSLFSPEVSKCLYPKVPDYILSAIQTGLLVLIGGITTMVMKDDTVVVSEFFAQHFTVVAEDESEDIPLDLQAVVERIAWVKQVSAD